MAPRLRCDGGISFLSLARIGYFYSIFVRRSLIGDCLERLKDAVGQVLESRRGCCLGFRATGLIFCVFLESSFIRCHCCLHFRVLHFN